MLESVAQGTSPAENFNRLAALADAMSELNGLTKKPKMSREENSRSNYLLSKISLLKSGFDPNEIARHDLNAFEAREGLPITHVARPRRTPAEMCEARAFCDFIRDRRVESRVGNVGAGIISSTGPGAFVPTQFLDRVFSALKQYDPLFDPDLVTYIPLERGGLLRVPLASDVENNAIPTTESSDATSADLFITGQAQLQPKSYKSPMFKVSLESVQDVAAFMPVEDLFEYYAAARIARGVGADLVQGSGAGGHILGLLLQLSAAGIVPVIATGSAELTGGIETGANSIGFSDLATVFSRVDPLYRSSPSCAWLMNDNTLLYLQKLITKLGLPLAPVTEGLPYLFGKPVRVSPSMPNIGASNQPVLFGDFRYFALAEVRQDAYVRGFWEAPGFVEQGIIGLKSFSRWDGQLLATDPNASPFALLQNHS